MALCFTAINRLTARARLTPLLAGVRTLQTGTTEKRASPLLKQQPQTEIQTFAHLMRFINQTKDVMNSSNPLFPVLRDNTIPARTRMSFTPYMAGFSFGFADFVSRELLVEKSDGDMSLVERKINEYIAEDDFHYNFYVRDLAVLGYKLEQFGSLEGALRFAWSPRGNGCRRVLRTCARALGYTDDPLMRLTIVELLEAGLSDLFPVVYQSIAKGDNDIDEMEYWGDTHINLEANHTVTAQFSGKEIEEGPDNEWKHEQMPRDVVAACKRAVVEVMDSYDDMYHCFHETIMDTHEGRHIIEPKTFIVTGSPPMKKCTAN